MKKKTAKYGNKIGTFTIKSHGSNYYSHYATTPVLKHNKSSKIDYSLFPFWVKWIDKILDFFHTE